MYIFSKFACSVVESFPILRAIFLAFKTVARLLVIFLAGSLWCLSAACCLSLQWGNRQRKCRFYSFIRCAARKAMDMNECMGQKCPFVSQPKLLPIAFRGSTSYVLSFFARAMALIAHAYSMMSVRRASNSFAFSKIFFNI